MKTVLSEFALFVPLSLALIDRYMKLKLFEVQLDIYPLSDACVLVRPIVLYISISFSSSVHES